MPVRDRGPGESYRPEDVPPSVHAAHQPAIATLVLDHLALVALDVTAGRAAELRDLLGELTLEAERAIAPPTAPTPGARRRSDRTLGLGPGLFGERFGLARRRPVALADLPAFPGDALEPAWTGGDLCLQVCADEAARGDRAPRQRRPRRRPGALRQRGRMHRRPGERRDGRPRNLLGFKDATANPRRGRDPRPPRVGPARRPHRDDGRDVPRRAARPRPARRLGNALSARSRSG